MHRNIVLIIGASSDIGAGLIEELQKDSLVLAHFNQGVIQEGANIVPLQCDLNNQGAIEKFIQRVLEIGIPNKIVFLASAKVAVTRFQDTQWEDFEQNFSIGLKSTFLLLKTFLPLLKKDKERQKKIVFMLSSYVCGEPPMGMSAYVSMKYALLGLMKSLVSEYKAFDIQINAISPSMIETKFLENIDSRIVELNALNHPLKRNATTKDVLPIIMMLLSQESNYLNGVNIPITGGSVF